MQSPPLLLKIMFPYETSVKNVLLYLTDVSHTAVGPPIPHSYLWR